MPKEKVSYFVDGNGEVTEIEYQEPIDNSESLVLGLVDDLGTSATIYLYGNTDKITSGSITITMPDNTTKSITATSDNTNITSSSNYTTYKVNKNGVYTFSATDGTTTAETKIRVKNIEKFTAVESLGLAKAKLKDGTDSENAYSYKGASVPVGYYVDTKTNVDTGLVVTDSIDEEGYSIGNEWVWVPVNSTVGNDEYYLETTATNIKLYSSSSTAVQYTKYSKLYSFSQPKTRDAYKTFYPYGNTDTGTLGNPSGTSGYREPAILTDLSNSEYRYYPIINNRNTGTAFKSAEGESGVAQQYVNDYNNMVTSVNNYGGFYIGRYEITANGEKPGVSLSSKTWYYLYNECMKFGKKDGSGNFLTESGMIYGTLWDATMQWLAKSNILVGYTGYLISGYGNHPNEAVTVGDGNTTITVKASGTSKKLQTGQTSYTKSNNIYDLSGNYYDWTQEASSGRFRVVRGGVFNATGYSCSANRYDYSPTGTNDIVSSRPHFYIK